MNGAFKRHMGRFLAALMLLMLICPAALADEQTADTWYFGGEGQDMVYDATPLPNGCLLLNGYTHPSRAGQGGTASRQTRAWLLCLNPDMSIAWEVIDTAEGTTRYVVPQVLPDGRISVLYYNSPSQVTEEVAIRYFTQDGEPAGETPLPAEPPFELPGDRCADGYLFTITDTGSVFANERAAQPAARAGDRLHRQKHRFGAGNRGRSDHRGHQTRRAAPRRRSIHRRGGERTLVLFAG